MARARNKKELLEFGEKEYSKLIQFAKEFEEKLKLELKIFDNRTIKDIIAHLLAWHKLVLNWYEVGMKGEKPEIPAPGYSFKTTPDLNEKLYQDYKNTSWTEVLQEFEKSHKQIMKLISSHTDEELVEKKKFKWTGTTNLASYLASATSSHYVWASELLRKKLKG